MKLFFDEDMGTGAATSILNLGLRVESVTWVRKVWTPKAHPDPVLDEKWIPWAAYHGYMALSRNTAIIKTDAQRQLVADAGLGIIFVPQHLSALDIFLLLVRRWTYLEYLYTTEQRPFMYHLPATQHPRRDPAIPLDYMSVTRGELIQQVAGSLRTATHSGITRLARLVETTEFGAPKLPEEEPPLEPVQGPPRPDTQLALAPVRPIARLHVESGEADPPVEPVPA